MNWVTIKTTHINTNNVEAFRWEDGELIVVFNASEEIARWPDPDRELYLALCRRLNVTPCKED